MNVVQVELEVYSLLFSRLFWSRLTFHPNPKLRISVMCSSSAINLIARLQTKKMQFICTFSKFLSLRWRYDIFELERLVYVKDSLRGFCTSYKINK